MDTPSIYVACLAAYNNGILHGKWISVDQSENGIYDEIHDMLEESPIEGAEEFALHDYEGFGDIKLSEYEDLKTIVKYAEFISEHGELGQALIADYGVDEANRMMEDGYQGSYDSEVDFAEHIIEECYSNAIPNSLICYFDFRAFARDLFIGEFCSVSAEGNIHVFSCY